MVKPCKQKPLLWSVKLWTHSHSSLHTLTDMQTSPDSPDFKIGQRVHSAGDTRRMGTVKYVGEVAGYSGNWVGVDWDKDGEGKHDGSINGVHYFEAKSPNSASFARPHNLSSGITLLQALDLRYRSISTKEEEGIHSFCTL